MKINFVSIANDTMASYRYHNAIPARELEFLGNEAKITPYPLEGADVYVFSKHFNYGEYWYLKALKAEKKKTVFHVCDNHMDKKGHKDDYYRKMIREADLIITPTQGMADIVLRETGKEAITIPDTYEFTVNEPSYQRSGDLRVLWFGHQFNLHSLEPELPLPEGCDLRMCTDLTQSEGKQATLSHKFDKIPYMPWSIQRLLDALKWCNCVILPHLTGNKFYNVKSHNRLIESVIRGKFVIGSSIPSYDEYKTWMYIGKIHDGLRWLQFQPENDVTERIRECQEYIVSRYSPSKVGEMWLKALKSL